MPTPRSTDTSSTPDSQKATRVLDAIVPVIVDHPELSLGEIAAHVGISRTTLYRLYPTRTALLRAIALHSIGQLRTAYLEVGITDAGSHSPSADEFAKVIRALVERMIPLGPALNFLLRSRELDGDSDIDDEVARLDRPLVAVIDHAVASGHLGPSAGSAWIIDSLFALVYTAWEHVAAGRIAPRSAPDLVLMTWLAGCGAAAPHPRKM